MLKKTLHTLFASYYLILSVGLSVSAHYCLGKVTSVSVIVAADPCACGAEESMPCCDTETLTMSLEDEQSFSKTLGTDVLAWIPVSIAQQSQAETRSFPSEKVSFLNSNGPPLNTGKDIRIHFHSLIFYA